MSLGDDIRAARLTREWSQSRLAEAAAVSRSAVARIEHGDNVSTLILQKVTQALDLTFTLVAAPGGHVHSRAALPEASYLERIGEIAYTVSYMEWTLLGDLNRLADQLPKDLTLASLEPKSTGKIAGCVMDAAKGLEDGPVKDYLFTFAKALSTVAKLRNDVLHARPATHPQQNQRLSRAEVVNGRTTGQRFWIDDDWLDEAINLMNECRSKIEAVRPPFE